MLINKEYDWQNKCILIAEDEEINYMFIEKILEGTGAKLLRAINGKQAVDIVNKGNVDTKIENIIMNRLSSNQQNYLEYMHIIMKWDIN